MAANKQDAVTIHAELVRGSVLRRRRDPAVGSAGQMMIVLLINDWAAAAMLPATIVAGVVEDGRGGCTRGK